MIDYAQHGIGGRCEVLVLGVSLALAGAAYGQEKTRLELHARPHEQWQFENVHELRMDIEVSADNGQKQQIQQTMIEKRAGTLEVLEVSGGAPVALRVCFDPDSGTSVEIAGQPPQQKAYELAGKTAVFRKRDETVSVDGYQELDAQTLQELRDLLEPDQPYFPRRAVAVGDTWDAGTEGLKRAFELGPRDSGTMQCELLGVRELNGRKSAELGIRLALTRWEEGFLETHIDANGKGMMDVASGRFTDLELKGQVQSQGTQQTAEGSVEAWGQGTVVFRMHAELRSAGEGEAGEPADSGAAGENPLGAEALRGPPDLAGTYTSDKLRLTLRRDGDQYTGEIRMGERTFPAKARRAGDKLEGSFEDNGHSFPFTITGKGTPDLRLETGGAKHELKREGPPPEPPNPLGAATPAGSDTDYAAVTGPRTPGERGAERAGQSPGGVPEGYTQPDGQEHVLIGPRPRVASAQAALSGAVRDLTGFFDAAPLLLGAVTDEQDREIQAVFTAQRGGQPVRGMLLCSTGDEGGCRVLFADPQEFAQELPVLLKAAFPNGARRQAKPVNWQTVSIPDGSGQLRVPEGWRITGGQKGMVDVSGPHGSSANLGIWAPIMTPAAVQGMPVVPPQLVVAPYCAPEQALEQVVPRMMESAAAQGFAVPTLRNVKVLETQALDWFRAPGAAGGEAKLIFWQAECTLAGQTGKAYSLSLIYTAPIDPTQWLYYASSVSAPAERFAEDLPLLLGIWQSWKVHDRVFAERLKNAAERMRQVGEIIRSTTEYRTRVQDNANAAWDHVIRGDWPAEDLQTGRRADIDNMDLRLVVQNLNRQAGYERYREVPFNQLAP